MATQVSSEQVFSVVKKHLTQIVEGLDGTAVAREKSMKDLGASSLDIVEVVSCSMRELRVRIPRSELSKLTSIGGLVDLLHQASEQSMATAPAA